MEEITRGVEDPLEKLLKLAKEDVNNVLLVKLLYFALMLSVSFIWNINAVTKGTLSVNIREKVANHQVFVVVLIIVALGLISFQLWNLKKCRRRFKRFPLPPHLICAVWFLGGITALFECWSIVYFILFSTKYHCDELVAINELQGSRNFQIVSRLFFNVSVLIFVLLQTAWLNALNIYHLKPANQKQRFIHAFSYIHVIALNLSIYMKTTLDEAEHSWEEAAPFATETTNGQKLTVFIRK